MRRSIILVDRISSLIFSLNSEITIGNSIVVLFHHFQYMDLSVHDMLSDTVICKCSFLVSHPLMVIHMWMCSSRSEEGIYYAIDLGGTSFRVMKLELGYGSMVINKKVEYRPVPEELTKGTSEVIVIICFTSLQDELFFSSCIITNFTLLAGLVRSNCLSTKELHWKRGWERWGKGTWFYIFLPRQTSFHILRVIN